MDMHFRASEQEIDQVVKALAPYLRVGQVICLEGDLGAGKTTLVRACLHHMMGAFIDVPSPTFTLCQIYETPQGDVHHYDLYRLERPEEIIEIGLHDFLPNTLSFIEWPAIIKDFLPISRIQVDITSETPDSRLFHIYGANYE